MIVRPMKVCDERKPFSVLEGTYQRNKHLIIYLFHPKHMAATKILMVRLNILIIFHLSYFGSFLVEIIWAKMNCTICSIPVLINFVILNSLQNIRHTFTIPSLAPPTPSVFSTINFVAYSFCIFRKNASLSRIEIPVTV